MIKCHKLNLSISKVLKSIKNTLIKNLKIKLTPSIKKNHPKILTNLKST